MEASDATIRIIYSLHLSLDPLPGSPAGAFAGLVVPLDRNGMSIGRNGRPRPPKRRTIDLRVGDEVMVGGRWRRVLGIRAYRESYAAPGQVDSVGAGYVVKPAALAKRVAESFFRRATPV